MDKKTIIIKINKFKPNDNIDEWMNVIDKIYDLKSYHEFRKEMFEELKIKNPLNNYKKNLEIISEKYKEYVKEMI